MIVYTRVKVCGHFFLEQGIFTRGGGGGGVRCTLPEETRANILIVLV